MAGRGFPPQPNALKMLKGNPGHRPISGAEPKIPPGELREPTDELDADALAQWRHIVPILFPAGLATPAEATGLTAWCQLWSTWLQVQRAIRKEGVIVVKRGIPQLNPLVSKAESMLPQLRQYLAEFGMTPASRSRIRVDQPAPKSKVDAFLEKYGG